MCSENNISYMNHGCSIASKMHSVKECLMYNTKLRPNAFYGRPTKCDHCNLNALCYCCRI